MNVTLARPSVNLMTLRDGTTAIAISGGPNRVLVRHTHAEALLDDIEDALDQMEDQ